MRDNYYIESAGVEAENETVAERLTRIAHLMASSDFRPIPSGRDLGRNVFVRTVDAVLAATRKYAPPLHWLLVAVGAIALFIYVRLVAFTVRLRTTGQQRWPNVPAPCVLALWHGNAPSLLVAFARRRPRSRCVIMIARDPRGDCLALLSRILGFGVVRGGGTDGSWNALFELAEETARGACAILTADGGGPARIAKVGAVALASAARVPLVPLAADCYPAIKERHKWDSALNPVPFGSVTVSMGPARSFETFVDLPSIEQARSWLEQTLNALVTQAV